MSRMPDVCAADVCAVLREHLEAMIPPHRRAPGWDAKWQELEDWADELDE